MNCGEEWCDSPGYWMTLGFLMLWAKYGLCNCGPEHTAEPVGENWG